MSRPSRTSSTEETSSLPSAALERSEANPSNPPISSFVSLAAMGCGSSWNRRRSWVIIQLVWYATTLSPIITALAMSKKVSPLPCMFSGSAKMGSSNRTSSKTTQKRSSRDSSLLYRILNTLCALLHISQTLNSLLSVRENLDRQNPLLTHFSARRVTFNLSLSPQYKSFRLCYALICL